MFCIIRVNIWLKIRAWLRVCKFKYACLKAQIKVVNAFRQALRYAIPAMMFGGLAFGITVGFGGDNATIFPLATNLSFYEYS
ncbi:hypothetical protein HMPREF9370_2105 [Neisseria wadsworthii 9715]|uniref:Uncharacterized protein n=1 Tax=Neisseria wadsworthii 9715 TaxID=1030841 RepID=G4CSM3_9NEIS|nr:hypothetical protein HMPREF9370_2105 [Neisseria wadsworthii 9715]